MTDSQLTARLALVPVVAMLIVLASAGPARGGSLHAKDDEEIARLACVTPHQVTAQEIENRSSGNRYSRVQVTCVSHGEDSGYRLRARTTCTRSRQAWQCRASTVAWSIPLGPNTVDVKVTGLVPADQAAEIVRYAASIRDFQRIPVSAIISGFCSIESDGNSSWLLRCAGLTLAIARDCMPGGCRYRAFAADRKLFVD
jgi:hypothetical protein